MAFSAELLRRGGEQQHTGNTLSDGFDHLIGHTGRFGSPFEVVRLIDDEQVPGGVCGLLRTLG